MKRIISLCFVLVLSAVAHVDETKIDVFFANGINTSEAKAQDSKRNIDAKFKAIFPDQYASVVEWDTVYNHTHGLALDLYESMLQKINEGGPSIEAGLWYGVLYRPHSTTATQAARSPASLCVVTHRRSFDYASSRRLDGLEAHAACAGPCWSAVGMKSFGSAGADEVGVQKYCRQTH